MKASVAWLFLLGACGGAGPSLAGTSWRLTELGGKPAPVGGNEKPATLELTADGNRAAGFAGCNRMSGTWEARGDSLRLGPFAVTRMMCDKGMDLEQAYLDALQKTRTWRLSAQGLELLGEGGTVARLEAQ